MLLVVQPQGLRWDIPQCRSRKSCISTSRIGPLPFRPFGALKIAELVIEEFRLYLAAAVLVNTRGWKVLNVVACSRRSVPSSMVAGRPSPRPSRSFASPPPARSKIPCVLVLSSSFFCRFYGSPLLYSFCWNCYSWMLPLPIPFSTLI